MVLVVVFQVSVEYNRTILMLVLNIVTLVLYDGSFAFQMFFNFRNVAFGLPFHAFTFTSDRPCLSVI